MVTQEGTRPLLVEIQALVDEAHAPNPRRLSVGLEQNRLAMLLAVLHRHAGIACFDQDVFVNAVGGVKITEPAADLAVLLAMVSACATSRCRRNWWCSAKWGWPAKCARCSAARNACAKPPSWVSRRRLSQGQRAQTEKLPVWRSSRWSVSKRQSTGCADIKYYKLVIKPA